MGRFSVLVRDLEGAGAVQAALTTDGGHRVLLAPVVARATRKTSSGLPMRGYLSGEAGTELAVEVMGRKQPLAVAGRVVLPDTLPRGHDFRIDLGLGVVLEICAFDFGTTGHAVLAPDEDDLEASLFSQFVVDMELLELRDLQTRRPLENYSLLVSRQSGPLYRTAGGHDIQMGVIREDCSFILDSEHPTVTFALQSKRKETVTSVQLDLCKDVPRFAVQNLQQPSFWIRLGAADEDSAWLKVRIQITMDGDAKIQKNPPFLAPYGPVCVAVSFRLNYGDIVLLDNTKNFSAKLVSFGTGSRWDHVGIIVPVAPHDKLCLMEATKQGVYAYPLEERLVLHLKAGAQLGVRRLIMQERSPAFIAKLRAFAEEHEGKPYEKLSNLIRASLRMNTTDDMEAIFCSELVASALHAVGLLEMTERLVAGNYQPKDFAADRIPGLVNAEFAPLKFHQSMEVLQTHSHRRSKSRSNSIEDDKLKDTLAPPSSGGGIKSPRFLSPRLSKKSGDATAASKEAADLRSSGGAPNAKSPRFKSPRASSTTKASPRFGHRRRASSIESEPKSSWFKVNSPRIPRRRSMNTAEAEKDVLGKDFDLGSAPTFPVGESPGVPPLNNGKK